MLYNKEYMFKCQVSGRISKPREKQYRITVESRRRDYFGPLRNDEGRIVRDADDQVVLTKIGEGSEIVKELIVCEEIYKEAMESMNG